MRVGHQRVRRERRRTTAGMTRVASKTQPAALPRRLLQRMQPSRPIDWIDGKAARRTASASGGSTPGSAGGPAACDLGHRHRRRSGADRRQVLHQHLAGDAARPYWSPGGRRRLPQLLGRHVPHRPNYESVAGHLGYRSVDGFLGVLPSDQESVKGVAIWDDVGGLDVAVDDAVDTASQALPRCRARSRPLRRRKPPRGGRRATCRARSREQRSLVVGRWLS